MNLAEIRNLLAFKDNPTVSCAWINELVDKHIADVYKAFGREKGVVKRLIGDGLFVQGETLGLFAVSSVGDQPIVDTGEGEYVLDFKSEQSWNVMAPIFWFLNRKGYVDTVESKN